MRPCVVLLRMQQDLRSLQMRMGSENECGEEVYNLWPLPIADSSAVPKDGDLMRSLSAKQNAYYRQ